MISALVLTKNEEKNIIDCLETLQFCDEIIIVDDDSKDRTQELIDNYKKTHEEIKVFKRKLDGNFSAQRKFGIEKAENNWILIVDADERISEQLLDEIEESISDEFGGFLIRRKDFIWGNELKYGENGNVKLLRLFDKRKGDLRGKVHEVWVTENKVGQLTNPILHYPHPTISEFLREINFYTDIRANELFDNGTRTNFVMIILYPKVKFIMNYFLKVGFLDGIPGLISAIMMSFHSFLVRGKLWLLWQKKQTS